MQIEILLLCVQPFNDASVVQCCGFTFPPVSVSVTGLWAADVEPKDQWKINWTRTTTGLQVDVKIPWIFVQPGECWVDCTDTLQSAWTVCVSECDRCFHWFQWRCADNLQRLRWGEWRPRSALSEAAVCLQRSHFQLRVVHLSSTSQGLQSRCNAAKRSKPQTFIEFALPIKVKLDHHRLPLNWQLCAALMWLGQRQAIF